MTVPVIADGLGLDRALGAMFCGAKNGETISVMSARGALQGRRWPCVMCRFLSWTVETDHCQKALLDAPTAVPAAIRAGAMLFGSVLVVWLIPLALWLLF